MKAEATKQPNDSYSLPDGSIIKREFDSLTPNGNKFNGRWTLRAANGDLIDYDKYINDLAERNDIELYTRHNINS